jgi:N6-adenosine-specific RNA methylase IME4
LDVAIDLIRGWDFKYKTRAFDCVKTTKAGIPGMGMGYWTRKASETCLLATRGKVTRKDKGVRQVHMEQRREHSRKPDEFYGRIEALVDGPYLEMFARQRWPGWNQWGDQADMFDIRES